MIQDQFNPAPLFGGAITCLLPSTFADVSEIRQVPDNQEVWLDTDGFTSIVFDILERVDLPDHEALKTHLEDIVEDAMSHVTIRSVSDAAVAKMPVGTPALTLIATSPPGEKMRGRANEPSFVDLVVVLVRLERQRTDLVVTVNVPHVLGTYAEGEVDRERGKDGPLLQRALEIRERVLGSLEVREWGLFGEE